MEVLPLVRGAARSALHRIDAWGVALIVCGVALWVHDAVTPTTLGLALAITLTYGLGYAINDFFDVAFDAQDAAKAEQNFFVQHPVSASRARAGFAAVAAVLLLAFAGFGTAGVVLFGVCLLVMWAYSAPPLRLKSRPGLDLLTHALFVQTFAYFICLLLIDARWTALDVLLLGINFLASLSGQLAQQIRDFDLDSRTQSNFATRVGRDAAIRCRRLATAALVLIVSVGFVAGTLPLVLAPIALSFLPATAHRLGMDLPMRSARTVYLPTGAALVYTGVLLCTRLWA